MKCGEGRGSKSTAVRIEANCRPEPSRGRATPAQQAEFTKGFQELFAKIAFPKVRKNFEHLGTVLYEPPKTEGGKTTVASVVQIDHPDGALVSSAPQYSRFNPPVAPAAPGTL